MRSNRNRTELRRIRPELVLLFATVLRPEFPRIGKTRHQHAARGGCSPAPTPGRAPFIWIGSPDTPDELGWISANWWPLIDPGTERMTP